jgi:hypothetical protein
VTMPGEEGLLDGIAAARPDAVLVRSLTALEYLSKRANDLTLIGDYSLNATNELTAAILAEAHVDRITPGYDLNAAQLAATRLHSPGTKLEPIVHGHVPMFHTAHCLISGCPSEPGASQPSASSRWPQGISPEGAVVNSRGRKPPGAQVVREGLSPEGATDGVDYSPNIVEYCSRDAKGWPTRGRRACRSVDIRLRDRNGHEHPLVTDPACRTTIFSARVQSTLALWPQVLNLRPAWMRVELLRESAAQTRKLLDVYAALFSETISPAEALRRLAPLYPAGITTGTLAIRAPSASDGLD